MADIHTILNERTKKSESSNKMSVLAKQTTNGYLTSFAGVFALSEISEKEKQIIQDILKNHSDGQQDVHTDADLLISITSEVKAINNQAAILHGERIKKAQQILIQYKDGAFTAWLLAAYGNRQTPYNLMKYYEFYEAMPKNLRPQIEAMPRQAVYVLASRAGHVEQKRKIVENYQGETKNQLLELIRHSFPLDEEDKRRSKIGDQILKGLEKIRQDIQKPTLKLTSDEKIKIKKLLKDIQTHIPS